MKDERIFSMFRVYDYKGGELSRYTNVTTEEIAGELAEMYYEDIFDLVGKTVEDIRKYILDNPMEESTYAGGDTGNFVGNIYEHVDNKLVGVSLNSCIEDIVQYIHKNWR